MNAWGDAETAVLDAVRRSIPLEDRLHRPTRSQLGAVGHVIGVRGVDGTRYALKIYAADRRHRADVESVALRRLRNLGLPVPAVHLSGEVGDVPVSFVLISWLDGRRWAECGAAIGSGQAIELMTQAGHLLRRLHSGTGQWFGDLLLEPAVHPTVVDLTAARLDRLVWNYRQVDGPDEMAHQVSRFVQQRYPALSQCRGPVLCHNDFVDGNLMVDLDGPPRISGVFDLERASWGDPMDDLALSIIHFRYHYQGMTAALLDAYGVSQEHERQRLQAYEALHLVAERCWISSDRPQGWQQSVAALDDRLRTLLNA